MPRSYFSPRCLSPAAVSPYTLSGSSGWSLRLHPFLLNMVSRHYDKYSLSSIPELMLSFLSPYLPVVCSHGLFLLSSPYGPSISTVFLCKADFYDLTHLRSVQMPEHPVYCPSISLIQRTIALQIFITYHGCKLLTPVL